MPWKPTNILKLKKQLPKNHTAAWILPLSHQCTFDFPLFDLFTEMFRAPPLATCGCPNIDPPNGHTRHPLASLFYTLDARAGSVVALRARPTSTVLWKSAWSLFQPPSCTYATTWTSWARWPTTRTSCSSRASWTALWSRLWLRWVNVRFHAGALSCRLSYIIVLVQDHLQRRRTISKRS